MDTNIITAASDFINSGISIIPVVMPLKKPATEWKKYQYERIDIKSFEQLAYPLNGTGGIAIVCGQVSGNLEVIDIDNKLGTAREILQRFYSDPYFKELVKSGILVIERTINGGYHIYYRCSVIAGNLKLARASLEGKIETVVETRGEGGYVVSAPTAGYKVTSGSLSSIGTITPDDRDYLFSLCRMENTYFGNYTVEKPKKSTGNRAGDLFNASSEASNIITDLLTECGYKYMYSRGDSQFWRRPGKTNKSISCCYNGQTLYVWSTNCLPFESERGYSNFQIFAYLKHDKNFSAAAKELVTIGFGSPDYDTQKEEKTFSHFLEVYKRGNFVVYKIDWRILIEILTANGFYRYDDDQSYYIIRVQNKVIEEVPVHVIGDFLESLFEGDEKAFVIKNRKLLTSKEQLASLPSFTGEINTDSKDLVFAFFSDCFVEITASTIETKYYEDLKGYVWKRHIKEKQVNLQSDPKDSDFHTFVKKVTDFENTPDRYYSLISIIGYMCSRYKSASIVKMPVLCDEGNHNNPDPNSSQGGTGKSLVAKAISHFRETLKIDARNFKFDSQFKFQRVRHDTKILWFDDATKFFPVDRLYSMITEGLEIERKNMNPITIDFLNSPKFILTTNYTIPDTSISTKRRIIEIEFAPYYNDVHQPIHDFGKQFFEDWTEEEWRDFYVFIFSCIQYYLKEGLKTYKQINLNARKLAQTVDEAFQEFFFAYISKLTDDIEGYKKLYYTEFYNQLINDTKLGKTITQTRSTQNIKRILDFLEIPYEEKKSHGIRYISFKYSEESNGGNVVF